MVGSRSLSPRGKAGPRERAGSVWRLGDGESCLSRADRALKGRVHRKASRLMQGWRDLRHRERLRGCPGDRLYPSLQRNTPSPSSDTYFMVEKLRSEQKRRDPKARAGERRRGARSSQGPWVSFQRGSGVTWPRGRCDRPRGARGWGSACASCIPLQWHGTPAEWEDGYFRCCGCFAGGRGPQPAFLSLTGHLSTARGVTGSLNSGVRGSCLGLLQPGRPV